jgi:periodic tryptophan protein 2
MSKQGVSTTLPFQNLKRIATLALSPDGALLVSIDEDGRALLINARQRALLHHFSFKDKVTAARFSPDGRYLAVALGRLLQVWRTPSTNKEVSPMHLHRTYGQSHADVTAFDWSPDSRWLAAGAKDLTVRVFSLDSIDGYQVPTLSGHREPLVGVFFTAACEPGNRGGRAGAASLQGEVAHLYTVSRDGALFEWAYEGGGEGAAAAGTSGRGDEDRGEDEEQQQEKQRGQGNSAGPSGAAGPFFHGGKWALREKRFFNQPASKLTAVDYHRGTGLVVAGFSSGVFDLYKMPRFEKVHALSISRERVTTVRFNATGEWIALGCAQLGQLLVWEWRSETYVLKQQGHYYDVSAVAFSPDGTYLATGADDNKVKVWNAHAGTCFVTFTDHTQPVTAVQFLPPAGQALVSASMDGTVRAFDLVRYRNFRTFTSPTPTQLVSLAVDPSGDVVVAGSQDTFQIFVWNVRTARLLDALSGHEGPVAALAFNPVRPLLASASWDKTVRLWDVFGGGGNVETLRHSHDVLAVAYRPDGKQLCSSTLDGTLHLWDPEEGKLLGTLEGRRDIARGRLQSDRRAAGNLGSGQCFTSLAFSADGAFLLAGGRSKFICLYDVEDRVLLARFQTSVNRSLDGVLDQLNSKRMTDAGALDALDDEDEDEDQELLANRPGGPAAETDLPGTGAKVKKAVIRTRSVALSPTGRAWCAATTEGVLVYGADEGAVFDPTDLEEDVTPQAVRRALQARAHLRALLLALRLNDPALVEHCVMCTPPGEVPSVCQGVPVQVVPGLLARVAELAERSPHLEFLLRWVQRLGVAHGARLREMPPGLVMPGLRALQKVLTRTHEDLASVCEANFYTLGYLSSVRATATPDDGEGMEEDGDV